MWKSFVLAQPAGRHPGGKGRIMTETRNLGPDELSADEYFAWLENGSLPERVKRDGVVSVDVVTNVDRVAAGEWLHEVYHVRRDGDPPQEGVSSPLSPCQ